MKNKFLFLVCGLIVLSSGCTKTCCVNKCNNGKICSINTDTLMEAKNDKDILACSLTDVEMKERMKIIEKFKRLIRGKKEIENGMVFQVDGDTKNLDEIINLIKLERKCCTFLTFELKVQKESVPISLTISGPYGTKDFLIHELGL